MSTHNNSIDISSLATYIKCEGLSERVLKLFPDREISKDDFLIIEWLNGEHWKKMSLEKWFGINTNIKS